MAFLDNHDVLHTHPMAFLDGHSVLHSSNGLLEWPECASLTSWPLLLILNEDYLFIYLV